MNDEYQWWLAALLASVGVTVLWLLYGKLPRREEDVEAEERLAEAYWISERLEETGETAPPQLVERVLDLHRAYLVEPPPGAPLRPDEAEPRPVPSAPPSAVPAERPATETPGPAADERGDVARERARRRHGSPHAAQGRHPARQPDPTGARHVDREPARDRDVKREPAHGRVAPEPDTNRGEQPDAQKRRPRRRAHRGEQPEPDLPGAA